MLSEEIRKAAQMIGLPADPDQLTQVVEKFPWFSTARVINAVESDNYDPLLELHLLFHPTAKPLVDRVIAAHRNSDLRDPETLEPVLETSNSVETTTEPSLDDIIDSFLNAGEYRITPEETTPEYDAAAGSGSMEITDDIATEQLARIYMQQGLKQQAAEIYRRLGKEMPESEQ